jgi:hypothetical protein
MERKRKTFHRLAGHAEGVGIATSIAHGLFNEPFSYGSVYDSS